MPVKNIQSNLILSFLVGILLITAQGCGGEVRSKEDKDFKEKHQKFVAMLKELPGAPPSVVELAEKLGDPLVSSKDFEELIKKYKNNDSYVEEGGNHQGGNSSFDPHQEQVPSQEEYDQDYNQGPQYPQSHGEHDPDGSNSTFEESVE